MKSNKLISIVIGLVIIVGAFLTVFGSSLKNLTPDTSQTAVTTGENVPINTPVTGQTKPVTSNTGTPTPTPSPKPQPAPSGYTLADVATHNSATSCWSAINGNVYNLTSWVNSHPGGRAAILMICGKDGSPLFNSQHGGSSRVASILDRFSIGKLN